MTKKTETVLLLLLTLAVAGGVAYEYHYLNKKGYLKKSMDQAKDGLAEIRSKNNQ